MKMKNILIFALISILMNCISADCSEGKRPMFLNPGQETPTLTVGNILEKLNDPDWKNRYEFLRKNADLIIRDENINKDQKIKAKLIKLLTQAHKLREEYFAKLFKAGKTLNQVNNEFYTEYDGFIDYACRLTEVIIKYKDPETVPLVLKTDAYYTSEEISVETYLLFGKPGFKKIIQAIAEDKERNESGNKRRTIYFLRLSGWIRESLEDSKMDKSLKLNPEELEEAKKIVIQGTDSKESNEVFYANYGLSYFIEAEKNEAEKKRLKNILKKSLVHKDMYVRENVTQFLGKIGDMSDLTDLEKLNNDVSVNEYIEKKHNQMARASGKSSPQPRYVVREAAQEAITKIKTRAGKK